MASNSKIDISLDELIRRNKKQKDIFKSRKKSHKRNLSKKFSKAIEISDDKAEKTSIMVTGLTNVDYVDIKDMFEPFAKDIVIKMHYNRIGAKLGSCEVIYPDRKSALKAAKTYDHVEIDGIPIKVTLMEEEEDEKIPDKSELDKEIDEYMKQKAIRMDIY